MPLSLQAGLLGLLFGPVAYVRINRLVRAAVSAGVFAVALLGFAYMPDLGVFAELNPGDMTPREAVATAVDATRIWLGAAPSWGTGLVVMLLVLNVPCAIDAARLATKPLPPPRFGLTESLACPPTPPPRRSSTLSPA